jgi:hypothetical protein
LNSLTLVDDVGSGCSEGLGYDDGFGCASVRALVASDVVPSGGRSGAGSERPVGGWGSFYCLGKCSIYVHAKWIQSRSKGTLNPANRPSKYITNFEPVWN